MRKWQVGCDLDVFSARVNVKECLDLALHDVRVAGFSGVEMGRYLFSESGDGERAGRLLSKHGLRLAASYYSARMWAEGERAQIVAHVRQLTEAVATLSGGYLVLSYPRKKEGPKTGREYEAQAETLREIGEICAERGVSATFHCYDFHLAEGERELREVLARIPSELLKLAPDLGWVQRAGVQPQEFIRRHGSRMNYVHLRDSKGGSWTEALGEGEADYASLAGALEHVGFDGWLVLELLFEPGFRETRPIGESLHRSREHLRSTMGV